MLADVLVLFGATGDLAQRKLYAALFELHEHKRISVRFRTIEVSRKDRINQQYCTFHGLKEKLHVTQRLWQ